MLHSRLFEEVVSQLWEEGLISAEMHLGMGEEAIVAGIVAQLQEGDAMALDHRGTPPLLMRGVEPVALLREFLGHPDGLCAGRGGHMHLFSAEHLAASSGIVGASGPAAVGFALAAQHLRQGTLTVAFFGEGAMNQGMLLESLNLAAVWKLPVLFVCKDDDWAITTPSSSVIGGDLTERAKGFGMPGVNVDGRDVDAVWHAVREPIERARRGEGPTFVHAQCVHIEGHFLGDLLMRVGQHPVKELLPMAGPLLKAFTSLKGTSIGERIRTLTDVSTRGSRLSRSQTSQDDDPLDRARHALTSDSDRLEALEFEVSQEIQRIVEQALASD
jgi:pyruvate dehydrogenase E1 component alpha subunit